MSLIGTYEWDNIKKFSEETNRRVPLRYFDDKHGHNKYVGWNEEEFFSLCQQLDIVKGKTGFGFSKRVKKTPDIMFTSCYCWDLTEIYKVITNQNSSVRYGELSFTNGILLNDHTFSLKAADSTLYWGAAPYCNKNLPPIVKEEFENMGLDPIILAGKESLYGDITIIFNARELLDWETEARRQVKRFYRRLYE